MTTSNKGKILIAGCQPDSVNGLSAILSGEGYDIIPSWTVEHADTVVDYGNIDAVITELESSNRGGLRLFEYVTSARPGIPVIFLTSFETVDLAVSAMTRGAFYYFVKPPDYSQLKGILARAIEQRRLKREVEILRDRLSELAPACRIVGNSPEMLKTLEVIEAIKESPASILITGETGTGKKLIARTLHRRSTRSTAPFIAINCAAIPAEAMEVELFGIEVHSADETRRPGKLEQAGDGTLMLDDIDLLGMHAQTRLLRILEDSHVAGREGSRKVDLRFRLVATTTEDLEEKSDGGDFSEGLYQRISNIEIKIPPLRERKDDIPLLASAFLTEFCTRQRKKVTLSNEVMRVFQEYKWAGNVRQLRNVIERAVALAPENKITLRELPCQLLSQKQRTLKEPAVRTLKQLELQAIRETLRKCNGNKSRTAKMLGISRKAFYKRLRDAEQFRPT